MFDLEYYDQIYLDGHIVLKYILAMPKWLDMFGACQTGRKYLKHLRLVGNVSAMSHC
jgi:hypothetical protein